MDQKDDRRQLIISLILIILFCIGLNALKQDDKVLQYIEDRELDTGALFYTDSPEAVEANYLLQKTSLSKD